MANEISALEIIAAYDLDFLAYDLFLGRGSSSQFFFSTGGSLMQSHSFY